MSELKEKTVYYCTRCNYFSNQKVDSCPNCHSTRFVESTFEDNVCLSCGKKNTLTYLEYTGSMLLFRCSGCSAILQRSVQNRKVTKND